MLEPIRRPSPTEIANPTSFAAGAANLANRVRQHCGTGISSDRDITPPRRDVAGLCASLPTLPPRTAAKMAENLGFSRAGGGNPERNGLSAGGKWIRTFRSAARKPAISEASLHDCGADGLNRSHRQDQRKQAESGRYQGENGLLSGRDDVGYIAVFELDRTIKGAIDTKESPAPSSRNLSHFKLAREPLTVFLPRSGSAHQAPADCIPAHSPYPPRTLLDPACRPPWSIGRAQRSCEPCRAFGQTSNSKLAIIFEIDHFLRRVAAESMWPSSSVPPRPDQRFASRR